MGSHSVTTGLAEPRSASSAATDWAVLGLVSERPRHGFDIARELAPASPLGHVWTVSRPLVYRSLDRLAQRGWLRARGSEPGGRGPAREVLEITSAGTSAFGFWLAAPVHHLREVRTLLLLKLYFLERQGSPTGHLVREQREVLQPLKASLAGRMARTEGFERLHFAWRLNFAVAVERFLEEVGAGSGASSRQS